MSSRATSVSSSSSSSSSLHSISDSGGDVEEGSDTELEIAPEELVSTSVAVETVREVYLISDEDAREHEDAVELVNWSTFEEWKQPWHVVKLWEGSVYDEMTLWGSIPLQNDKLRKVVFEQMCKYPERFRQYRFRDIDVVPLKVVSEDRPNQRRPYQGYWDGTPFVYLAPHKEVRDTISLIIKHYDPVAQTLRYCGFKRFSRFITVTKVLDQMKAFIGLDISDPVDIYDCWRRVPEKVDVSNTLESLCLRTGDILVLQKADTTPTFDAMANSTEDWKYPFPAQGKHRYNPPTPPPIATPDINLQLYEYATQRKYTDIVICNPDATVAAYAHKPVLATLPYFQKVFDHPGALDAIPHDQFGHAVFPAPEGTSQLSMYAFLRFLYTRSWTDLVQGSTAQLLEIIRLAEFYNYMDLFNRAVHHFELAHFDIDVAMDGLEVMTRCTNMVSTTKERIKGLCLSYIIRHWGEVALTPRFKKLVDAGGELYESIVEAVDKALH